MDTAIIISIILLIFFAYAIFQYTRDSESEVTDLTEKDETYLLSELSSIKFWVWITAIAGFMFTAGYALNFMSGSSIAYIHNWGASAWIGAFSGLLAALVITGAQKSIYTSYSTGKAGLIGTGLIISFVVFSEVSAPIEREELKVKEISQNSQTYQAVVGAIKGSSTASPSAYSNQLATAQAEKAKHVFELGRCDRHKPKGEKRVQRCETYEKREIAKYQAQIDSYQARTKEESNNNQATSLALVDKAKALENNQDNHSGIIKTMMEVLGVPVESAMLLASLLFITAFEIAFHYLGTRQAVLTEALTRMGNVDISYAEEYKRMKQAEKFRAKTDGLKASRKTTQDKDSPTISINKMAEKFKPQHVGFTPATQFTSNQHTGTHEQQYDMFPVGNKNVDLSSARANREKDIEQIKTGKPNQKPRFKLRVKEPSRHRTLMDKIPDNQPVKNESKTPVSDHSPVTYKIPAIDLSAKVSNNLSAKVKQGFDFSVLGEDSFSKLYEHMKAKIIDKTMLPTVPKMTAQVREYVKSSNHLKKTVIAIPECRYLATQVRDKLLSEKLIIENPNYKNGLPKYLVA